jgi:hypothetical protein
MIITDEKWNDIVATTKAGIDKWKTRAADRHVKDNFTVANHDSGAYSILLTTHHDGFRREHCVVAREIATGELRTAKLIMKRRKGIGPVPVGYSIKTPDPKGWNGLANKSADAIVKKLGLLRYAIFISASFVAGEPISVTLNPLTKQPRS